MCSTLVAGGNFQNFQDGDTWLETWQAAAEQCGAPVAPHDGSRPAAGAMMMLRARSRSAAIGSHIGLPRTVNGADLPNVAVPESVTYDVLSFDSGEMTIDY